MNSHLSQPASAELPELLQFLDQVTREAAALIEKIRLAGYDTEFKSPGDPVTSADQAANDLICERLRARFPDIPIVAEESPESSFEGFRKSDKIFFVDPLDGTREFVAGSDEFVVMIGLIEGDRATAGVVCQPSTQTTWLGHLDHGAFRKDAQGHCHRIHVSQCTELLNCTAVISHSHCNDEAKAAAAALGIKAVFPMGSAGLKGAVVASGKFDAYLAPVTAGKRWDAAAVDALIHAAGGSVRNTLGEFFDYRSISLDNSAGFYGANSTLMTALLEGTAQLG